MYENLQKKIDRLASQGVAFRFDVAAAPTSLRHEISQLCPNAHIISARSTVQQRHEIANTPPGKLIFLRDFLPTLEVGLLHSYSAPNPPAGAVVVPEILTPKQVAAMLGCSTNTLRNQRSRYTAGEPVSTPPWRTHNKRVIYFASDLKQWLESRPIYGL